MIFRVHFKPTFLGCIFQNNSRIISITHNASCHLRALSHSTIYRCRSRCSYYHPHFIDANTETQKGDLMGRKTETGGLVTMLYCFFLFFKISFIYLRERERAQAGEREKQATLQAGRPTQGSIPHPRDHDLTLGSWPELKADTQPTEPPRSPSFFLLLKTAGTHGY